MGADIFDVIGVYGHRCLRSARALAVQVQKYNQVFSVHFSELGNPGCFGTL